MATLAGTNSDPSTKPKLAVGCKHLKEEGTTCVITGISASTTPEMCRGCCALGKEPGLNRVNVLLAVKQLQADDRPVPEYLTKYLESPHDLTKGPGTALKNLLSWFVTKPPNCSCDDRAELMNLWGVEGCRENFRTILGWLRESALDNNYPYNEFAVAATVKLVLSISERKIIL